MCSANAIAGYVRRRFHQHDGKEAAHPLAWMARGNKDLASKPSDFCFVTEVVALATTRAALEAATFFAELGLEAPASKGGIAVPYYGTSRQLLCFRSTNSFLYLEAGPHVIVAEVTAGLCLVIIHLTD